MSEEPAASYRIRFRHTSGDIGPLSFGPNTTMKELKEKVFSSWPKEAPWDAVNLTSPNEVVLNFNGRMWTQAEDAVVLSRADVLGEVPSDALVTMLVMVRAGTNASAPTSRGDSKGGRASDGSPMSNQPKCCSCCIQ